MDRYDQLNELLCDPAVASDPKRLREYSKEQSGLEELYRTSKEYETVINQW
jgi:peptide chain release factor 1